MHAIYLLIKIFFHVEAYFCQLHKFFHSQELVQNLSKLPLEVKQLLCLKFGAFLSFVPSWKSPCGFVTLIVIHHKNQKKQFIKSEK